MSDQCNDTTETTQALVKIVPELLSENEKLRKMLESAREVQARSAAATAGVLATPAVSVSGVLPSPTSSSATSSSSPMNADSGYPRRSSHASVAMTTSTTGTGAGDATRALYVNAGNDGDVEPMNLSKKPALGVRHTPFHATQSLPLPVIQNPIERTLSYTKSSPPMDSSNQGSTSYTNEASSSPISSTDMPGSPSSSYLASESNDLIKVRTKDGYVTRKRGQPVPEETKDETYFMRRQRNNLAAKRSRDLRRKKEDMLTARARELEDYNSRLREQMSAVTASMEAERRQLLAELDKLRAEKDTLQQNLLIKLLAEPRQATNLTTTPGSSEDVDVTSTEVAPNILGGRLLRDQNLNTEHVVSLIRSMTSGH